MEEQNLSDGGSESIQHAMDGTVQEIKDLTAQMIALCNSFPRSTPENPVPMEVKEYIICEQARIVAVISERVSRFIELNIKQRNS